MEDRLSMPVFGPGGNGEAFRLAGGKSTLDAPHWLKQFGLDADHIVEAAKELCK